MVYDVLRSGSGPEFSSCHRPGFRAGSMRDLTNDKGEEYETVYNSNNNEFSKTIDGYENVKYEIIGMVKPLS